MYRLRSEVNINDKSYRISVKNMNGDIVYLSTGDGNGNVNYDPQKDTVSELKNILRNEFNLSKQEYIHLIDYENDNKTNENDNEMLQGPLPQKDLNLLMFVNDVEMSNEFQTIIFHDPEKALKNLDRYRRYLVGYNVYSNGNSINIDTENLSDFLSMFSKRGSFSLPIEFYRDRNTFLAKEREITEKLADKYKHIFGLTKKRFIDMIDQVF